MSTAKPTDPRYRWLFRFASGALQRWGAVQGDYTSLDSWMTALWEAPQDQVDLQQLHVLLPYYEESGRHYLGSHGTQQAFKRLSHALELVFG